MDKTWVRPLPDKALGLWLGVECAALFLGAALQRHFPAALAEALCGIILGLVAWSVWAGRAWAPKAAVYALLVALAGVLLGISAAAGRLGLAWNEAFHSIIFISLWINVGLLPVKGHPAAT